MIAFIKKTKFRAPFTVVALIILSSLWATCSNSPMKSDAENSGSSNSVVQPIFADDYLETFIEVRDCRFSSSHPGMVRVLVNDIGADFYLNKANPLPVGTIVVKEIFDGTTCDDYSELGKWAVMRKEAAGFDSLHGNWIWQELLSDRSVLTDSKMNCIGCHRRDECVSRDYMCTVQE